MGDKVKNEGKNANDGWKETENKEKKQKQIKNKDEETGGKREKESTFDFGMKKTWMRLYLKEEEGNEEEEDNKGKEEDREDEE